MSVVSNQIIPSVNYHLLQPCNMKCGFCFATFEDVRKTILPKGSLPKIKAQKIVHLLIEAGFTKINFAGGEPTLYPHLSDLIILASDLGATTSIVTNGTKISEKWLASLDGKLNWVALSIDSINDTANKNIGRIFKGKSFSAQHFIDLAKTLKSMEVRLKVNTVVCSENYTEDMSEFIGTIGPERWKIFQVLPIKGQNDEQIDRLTITNEQFSIFLETNAKAKSYGVTVVPETNSQMTESYVMVDPAGRFFQNSNGAYFYSEPLLDVGVNKALAQIRINADTFHSRDGLYDWAAHSAVIKNGT